MHQLYEQSFPKRCSPHPSHVDEPGANPLNLVCYMWCELLPIYGMPDNPAHKELDETFLQVMDGIHPAIGVDPLPRKCPASNGFGHWQHYYPEGVGAIIIDTLKSNRAGLKSPALLHG
jgi:hypothetical protein